VFVYVVRPNESGWALFDEAGGMKNRRLVLFSFGFLMDRAKYAPSVPRSGPGTLCPNEEYATIQSTLVTAFSVKSDGLNAHRLHV
jgi:hypothetical protein